MSGPAIQSPLQKTALGPGSEMCHEADTGTAAMEGACLRASLAIHRHRTRATRRGVGTGG